MGKSQPYLQEHIASGAPSNVGHPPPLWGNPQYPPQPHHTQAPSRSFQVAFTSWTTRHISVTEMGPIGSAIYTVDLHTRKPQMIFKLGTADAPYVTVEHRTMKTEVDIHFPGHKITLPIKARLKYKTTFASHALPNAQWTWRSTGAMKFLDFECTDQNSMAVARFKPASTWSMHKMGQMELVGPVANGGPVFDEVMITGIAFAYYVYLTHMGAGGTAAASASAAAAVS
ncbi:hypothetical protein BDV25DRAFT_148987 [Aspergillus avenaceus]|uniref:Tubby C-terminal-like domain-containing protein n=1 Tax=Aspergillus avenaceus TaxID=36643 RepID=A0A5N6U4X7_ASPAV|nr:hypothetical protein BDV25DRAFT_148987 [Aspergillus avenaceus]